MDVAGIATTLGAGAGAAIGWFGSSGDRLNQAGTATSIGAAAGGALGVGIWSACRATAPAGLTGGPGADEDLLAQFRALARAEIRGQWRVLLDGRDRLDTTFSGYGTIAPPRGHAPPVRQGSDLVAAVDAAAAAGAPRLLIVGPPGHGKTVALLDAAQHLVDHHHDRFGSPVLLNLGVFQRLLVSQAVVSDAIDEGRAASWVSVGLHLAVFAIVGGSTLWLGIGRPAGLVLGVIGGLILGVAIAADRGGWFLVMQHRVRRTAACQGLLPHPVVPFIQAAVDSRILRRTGGGVQFRHGVLAARLAEDAPRPGLMDLRRLVGFDPAADTP